MTYQEVFTLFLGQMQEYFEKIEQDKYYYFTGRLQDIVNNERLLIDNAADILKKIRNRKVCIWESGKQTEQLFGMLGLMNIAVEAVVSDENGIKESKSYSMKSLTELSGDELVLISGLWDDDLERKLQSYHIQDYYFMDRMSKYLAVVWCSDYPTEAGIKGYTIYY
jgi:hypothetical protein